MAEVFGARFALMDLDALKQKGFYSHQDRAKCCSNVDGITPDATDAVLAFSWRVIDSLNFSLSKNLETYRRTFLDLRVNMDKRSLGRIRRVARQILEDKFGPAE